MINCPIAWKVFFGWIITLLVVGGTTGLLVAQGIYAPTIDEECQIIFNQSYYNITG